MIGFPPQEMLVYGVCYAPVQKDPSRVHDHLAYRTIALRTLAMRSQHFETTAVIDWHEEIGAGTGGWPFPTDSSQRWGIESRPNADPELI